MPSSSDNLRAHTPFRRVASFVAPLALLSAAWAIDADAPPGRPDPAAFDQTVKAALRQYCVPCHGGAKPSAGVDLGAIRDFETMRRDPALARRVLKQLDDGAMPPAGMAQPPGDQRKQLVRWFTDLVNAASPAAPDPGRVVVRRLTRAEYDNTVRDLLGVDSKPADQFPADGSGGGGFDNNADTLFLPPLLMERYLEAANRVLREAKPDRIFVVRPGHGTSQHAAARRILERFASRAYRRPASDAEVAMLIKLFDGALARRQPFEDAVKFAMKAVLISPRFLYRVEVARPAAGAYRVDDYELASRLSYFLWSSMPDDELFHLAAANRLHDPGVLDPQVRRMLESPKAAALGENFAGQWLRVRDLYTTAQPDPGRFPSYTPALRDAMYHETIDFFDAIVREDDSLLRLLDANFTYVNEDLANFYGIAGVKGPEMRRVLLADRRRGGVLGMAGVLTLTSYPERTSPVLRGKWVLEQVFGTPPPPPPPNAGGLPASDAPKDGLTFRQRLEEHRKKPECASCHARMDPLGFGLENFDAIGRWRTEIAGKPVDASGVLTDGAKFTGPVELKQHLLALKQEFVRNVTQRMLAYALGRGLDPADQPTADRIAAAVARDGCRAQTLIREIVKSYPFQYRKDPPADAQAPVRQAHR